MSLSAPLADIQNYTLSCKGPGKTNFLRIYASGGLANWTNSSRSVQYFYPPFKYFIGDRSSMEDNLTVTSGGATIYPIYNPAVNNRWLSARMQIGSTEVMNISNLNNGYSRAVRDPCTSVNSFYGNNSCATNDSSGKIGEPCPSRAYPGAYQLLQDIAAVPTIIQARQESPYAPSYYLANSGAINVGFAHCGTPNIPPEVFICDPAGTTLLLSDKFCNYPGTILSCPVALPTGSGGVLELVQDSLDKSFAQATAAAGAFNVLLTLVQNTAPTAFAGTITTNQFLSLCVLANDSIENAEAEYAQMLGNGVEIELPYIDQINQSIGAAAGAFSTNVTLPVANRRVKFVSSVLVLPGTSMRTTQCNGALIGAQNLISARAFINSVPDTNDELRITDGTLHMWNYSNSLAGSPLGDAAAYMAHPVYISNLTGMPLPELQKPQNQGLELGRYFDGQMTYQLTGSQADATARTCQFYVVSGRKAIVSPSGINFV